MIIFEQSSDAEKLLQQLVTLADPIHQFFDNNLVMSKDVAVKNNRLSLLQKISKVILSYADFTKVEWSQEG